MLCLSEVLSFIGDLGESLQQALSKLDGCLFSLIFSKILEFEPGEVAIEAFALLEFNIYFL